jgi:hypothetical protein
MSNDCFAWACFRCRKSFKKANRPAARLLSQPVVTCPDCRDPLECMGRKFAAPRQPDVRGWQQARVWWQEKKRHEIATKTWQERRDEKLVLPKKLQAKQQRQIARDAWIKQTRRKIYLKNLEKWSQQ